ncbi:MAG TPA: primosomal protein N' [Tepidiformaceae bacterium]|mgnify:CR=1 FL=1|nr:primosomal protein N' [Tepidiformaceae bacterium]
MTLPLLPRNDPAAVPAPGTRFAEVAVNAAQPARTPFTYSVPDGIRAAPGQAVFVPFGQRILQGIVLEISDQTTLEAVRPIAAVADPEPILDRAHIELARWMSAEYLAPLWDCVACCLPSGYGQKAVTMVSPVEIPPLLPIYPRDRRILQFIAEHGRVTVDALKESLGGVSLTTLQRLQRQGHLTVAQGLARPTGRPRFERRIALAGKPLDAELHARQLAEKRPNSIPARILAHLAVHPDCSLAEIRDLGATPAHLAKLAEDGWLHEYQQQVERDPLSEYRFTPKPPPLLSADQQAAADAAWAARVSLLHGVTGAGKTEVYLDLVRRALEAGGSAIVLVPEISLTPQAIRRYGERFGETLTVLHSQLSTGELFDQWFRIQRGEARLVVGSRSAVFAPAHNLRLVVLDEEHEWSYKQADPQPRYHARDAAETLCSLTGARLVLGSATPDVLTYHRSEVGAIERIELRQRLAPAADGGASEGAMPAVQLVDMREELRQGNRSVFSRALRRAVHQALKAGEQSILFVNRRGSARFVLCRDCGFLPLCPSCEVSMSLDLSTPVHPLLRCHHCGRQRRLEDRCPKCHGTRYRPFGVGTQRIEQEAKAAFPSARVARWDSDVSRQKGSHERMVRALEAREVDILVGTQMLAKGLDLPEMTVVGVVDADVGLSLPDFHAHERTFQLLSQVAGRAGRRDKPGWVYIQTYEPEAPPILAAAHHDYRAFYEEEIAHRRRAGYPPFTRIVRMVHRDSNAERGLEEASRVASELRVKRDAAGRAEPDILGPTQAYIARVRGEYRWQVLLRGRNPAALLGDVRLGERWHVDVDPASLL